MAPLALPHCLALPYWHRQLVLSYYPHQPESHQLSLQNSLVVSDLERSGPIDRTPGTPGSDKKSVGILEAHLHKVRESGNIFPCNLQLCMQFWWDCVLFLVYLQIWPSIAGYTVHANQGCMETLDTCKQWMTHTHPLWCDKSFLRAKTGRKHPEMWK